MPLTNVDTTSGPLMPAQGPTQVVRKRSNLEAMAPSISNALEKGINKTVDTIRQSNAEEAVSKLYGTAVASSDTPLQPTDKRFNKIVEQAKQAGAHEPYLRKLRELKAQAAQGITTTETVSVAAEAMLKEAMVNDPGSYDILLAEVQKQLGINPRGSLLRLEDSVAQQAKSAEAARMKADAAYFDKELTKFVEYSGLGVYQAKAAIEAALPYVKGNIYDSWDKLPDGLKNNPYIQYRRNKAIEVANKRHLSNLDIRIKTMQANTNLAAEKLNPIIHRMADTAIASPVQKLNYYHDMAQRAKNSGDLDAATRYQELARRSARELVDTRQSLIEGAGTLSKEWLIQTGLVPADATDEDIAKFRSSPAGKAIQNYNFENNALYNTVTSLVQYYTGGKGDTDLTIVNETKQRVEADSMLTLYANNPKLPATMAVIKATGGVVGPLQEILNEATGNIQAMAAFNKNNMPEFLHNLSNKYAVANNMPLPQDEDTTKNYAHKASLKELKAFLDNDGKLQDVPEEQRYAYYAQLANVALTTTDSANASDVREFFKLIGNKPKVIQYLSKGIADNSNMSPSAKRNALSKLASGIYTFKEEVDSTFMGYKNASWFPKDAYMSFDNSTGSVGIQWKSDAVTYGKYRPIRRDASKLKPVITDAINSEKALLLLTNPNLGEDTINLDGLVVSNPLDKLAAIAVSEDYDLPKVSGIDEAEYEKLSALLSH